MAHLLGRLHRPAPQPADADHAAERRRARAAVDVSDRHSRLSGTRHRELADRRRRRALRHRQQQPGVGDRRARRAGRSGATGARCRRISRRRCAAGPSTAASRCSAIGCTWARSTRTWWRSTEGPAASSGTSTVGDLKKANAITAAPLVVKDKVIIGVAGGDFASRGFIDAYDAQTGERAWRFYTIPGPGEPGSESWPNAEAAAARRRRRLGHRQLRSGAEPGLLRHRQSESGLLRRRSRRATTSTPARSSRSTPTPGKLRWHYQFTPHDVHDWDSAHVPVLADLTIGGRPRKVVMVANRNGFFYTLDRETGKLLVGKPFIDGSNWAKEIGPDGRPIVLDNIGTPDKCLPDNHGGTNFMPPSFDPDRRLFFVTAHETCAIWEAEKAGAADRAGRARAERRPEAGRRTRAVRRRCAPSIRRPASGAGSIATGRIPSTVSLDLTGGIMSTASGLVFTGDNDGYFYAFDAATGKELWRFQTGAPVWGSAPVTYMLDGRQWVLTTVRPDVCRLRPPALTSPLSAFNFSTFRRPPPWGTVRAAVSCSAASSRVRRSSPSPGRCSTPGCWPARRRPARRIFPARGRTSRR